MGQYWVIQTDDLAHGRKTQKRTSSCRIAPRLPAWCTATQTSSKLSCFGQPPPSHLQSSQGCGGHPTKAFLSKHSTRIAVLQSRLDLWIREIHHSLSSPITPNYCPLYNSLVNTWLLPCQTVLHVPDETNLHSETSGKWHLGSRLSQMMPETKAKYWSKAGLFTWPKDKGKSQFW